MKMSSGPISEAIEMSLLQLESVIADYGGAPVVKSLNLSVHTGEIVGLMGRNGAGKTTTLKSIVGLLQPRSGVIRYDGEEITGIEPHQAYERGIRLVEEDRGIFGDLTVEENLMVPIAEGGSPGYSVDELYAFFPRLEERKRAEGDHLSGGEQQMLAIARALRSQPNLLLLDEPSEGLAPQIIEDVVGIIEEIAAEGTTILLVEQNVNMVLNLSDRVYVLDHGELVAQGTSEDIRDRRSEMEKYLGVGYE